MDDHEVPGPDDRRDRAFRLAQRLVEARSQITSCAPQGDDIVFLWSTLVRCTLPHRIQTTADTYDRRDGNRMVTFTCPPGVGLPFGTWARLILIHLTTETLRQRAPQIVLPKSLKCFMKRLGASATGGESGSIKAFKDQFQRVAAMTVMTHERVIEQEHPVALPVATGSSIGWLGQVAAVEGHTTTIRLSPEIHLEMLKSAVPLDRRAVRAVRQSPFALDLYCWTTYRAHRLRGTRSALIPWCDLRRQFGAAYASESDFRTAFTTALDRVRMVYPYLLCEVLESHFLLHPSPTSVPAAAARAAARAR